MIPLRALLPLLPLWLSAPAMAQVVGDDAVPVDDRQHPHRQPD